MSKKKVKTVRVFKTADEDGNELVYEFRRPSQGVMSKAELVRRSKFSEAFRAGVVVNAEVFKILRERGLWGDDEEAESTRIRGELSEAEQELKDEGLSNEDGMRLVAKIKALRLELDGHQAIATQIADATCESIANESVNMFYAAACVYNKTTGQKVYKDLEDFRSRLNETSTIDSYREATIASLEVLIGQDLPSDLSTQYTENKWLAERGLDKDDEPNKDEGEETPEEDAEAPEPEKAKKPRKKRTKKPVAS
jgi:hypothetical protein